MRTLKDNSPITPVQVDADFPDGAIIDETISVQGTAVIREIYNDILVNMYKLLRLTGTTSNGLEDSEATTYQIIGALQKLPNVLNDIERLVTLTSTTFAVDMDITLLPNKYVFIAKVVGAYGAGSYTFKGTTSSPSYTFTSPTGFNDGAELLIIIDHSTVRAYAINPGIPATGSLTFTASDILGSDPFFFLPLTGTSVPAMPKYITMYVESGDPDDLVKMIQPVQYNASVQSIYGMSSPTDFPDQFITLFFA